MPDDQPSFGDLDERWPSKFYKTGMRVPTRGFYEDQHGVRTFHEANRTFAPCVGGDRGCAYRQLVQEV